MQTAIYNNQHAKYPTSEEILPVAQKTMMIESYVVCALYLILAALTYFFFYHHPSHIGI